MAQLLFAVLMAVATSRELPSNLATSLHDAPSTLTSVVVMDIDRDGDVDVVATDAALHLFVWINDGTGRLVRQAPAPLGRAATATPANDVARRTPAATPLATVDPPPLDAHAGSPASVAVLAAGAVARVPVRGIDRPRGARVVRGPPTRSPLL